MDNTIPELLYSLKLADKNSVVQIYPRVRDREDVAVLRCRKSGVIFLSRSDHMNIAHYENCHDLNYWGQNNRKEALAKTAEDDHRRAKQFLSLIKNKTWLDIGTGLGGILDLLKEDAANIYAIEPQKGAQKCLRDCGYKVYGRIDEVPVKDIDVTTLFHVFEHLTDPMTVLRDIKQLMRPGGTIVIEVPHAGDALLSRYNCEPFKAFTFWSEHLILHTRLSLGTFLESAGFKDVKIEGFQRYPLANHLYWLSCGKPGGHEIWNELRSDDLEREYARCLDNVDQTDTLIALAKV